MYAQTKPQPVAVCTVCGAFGYSTRNIGVRCGKPNGGRRCMGIRGRATDRSNWMKCPQCDGTGRCGDDECTRCFNSGWLFVRPAPVAAAQEG
jgi:hypothetical protein